MTTSTDITALKGGDKGTAEQARKAVKEFRRLQPTLTAYARVITKNPNVRVEMAATDNGSTDGKRIFFRPPIALGRDIEHRRQFCDKRDADTGELRCGACAAREDVLTTIYHEIAHIAFESFADVDIEDAAAIADAAEAAGGAFGAGVAERIRKAVGSRYAESYIALCNLVSPYMPILWNALEDARVNERMFKARPGTKVMFDVNTQKIFREGVEGVDKVTGEISNRDWRDAELNMQILIGLFCKASGYNYSGWFRSDVEAHLGDEELTRLIAKMSTVRSAQGIYNLCFPTMKRLRELGYCKAPEDPPEPEPEEPDASEQQDESVEEDPSEDSSEGEDAEQEGEDGDSDTEPDHADAGEGGSDAADESDDGRGDSPGEDEEEGDDASESADGGSGGSDRQGEGGEADDDDQSESVPDPDPDADAGDSGASGASGDGDSDGDRDDSGEGEPSSSGVPSEAGADPDPAGSDVADNAEGGVGEPDASPSSAGEEAGETDPPGEGDADGEAGEELGEDDRGGGSGAGPDDSDADPSDESTDGGEAGAAGQDELDDDSSSDAGPEGSAGGEESGDQDSSDRAGQDPRVDSASMAPAGGEDSDGEGDSPESAGGEAGPADEAASGDDGSGDSDSEEASGEPESAGITGTGDLGPDPAAGKGGGGSGEDHSGADAQPGGDAAQSDPSVAGDPQAPDHDLPSPDVLGGGDGDDAHHLGEGGRIADQDESDITDEDGFIDTGADDGQGGTELVGDDTPPPPHGSPEEVRVGLIKFGDHEEKPKTMEQKAAENAVDVAILQGLYFETPSGTILTVREHRWNQPVLCDHEGCEGRPFNYSEAWDSYGFRQAMSRRARGVEGELDVPENILGPALMRMRVAFADNMRGKNEAHRRSGKINPKVLGKRAPLGDDRLFRRKVLPGKKDYHVIIGMDISGSTIGRNLHLEKRAVAAQAELCRRLGVSFSIYAHSGNFWDHQKNYVREFALEVYHIKGPDEVWDTNTQARLEALGSDAANLDGHFLEYLVRKADEVRESDAVILYYSDGKMPAENYEEELEILQREIKKCAQKRHTLLGVGIRTDSPARHGLDTVQVDDDSDIVKVVKHLEKRLMAGMGR